MIPETSTSLDGMLRAHIEGESGRYGGGTASESTAPASGVAVVVY